MADTGGAPPALAAQTGGGDAPQLREQVNVELRTENIHFAPP